MTLDGARPEALTELGLALRRLALTESGNASSVQLQTGGVSAEWRGSAAGRWRERQDRHMVDRRRTTSGADAAGAALLVLAERLAEAQLLQRSARQAALDATALGGSCVPPVGGLTTPADREAARQRAEGERLAQRADELASAAHFEARRALTAAADLLPDEDLWPGRLWLGVKHGVELTLGAAKAGQDMAAGYAFRARHPRSGLKPGTVAGRAAAAARYAEEHPPTEFMRSMNKELGDVWPHARGVFRKVPLVGAGFTAAETGWTLAHGGDPSQDLVADAVGWAVGSGVVAVGFGVLAVTPAGWVAVSVFAAGAVLSLGATHLVKKLPWPGKRDSKEPSAAGASR